MDDLLRTFELAVQLRKPFLASKSTLRAFTLRSAYHQRVVVGYTLMPHMCVRLDPSLILP